jgi:hypothetical protein
MRRFDGRMLGMKHMKAIMLPKRPDRRTEIALSVKASIAILLAGLVVTPSAAQSVSFEDCHANSRSFFLAANDLREQARRLSDEGLGLWAASNPAWAGKYSEARQKQLEANQLMSRGEKERFECNARVRAAAAERQKALDHKKAWAEAEKPAYNVKVKYNLREVVNLGRELQNLRAAKGDFRASLSSVSKATMLLRNSVQVQGYITGRGPLDSIMADQMSRELLQSSLSTYQNVVNDAMSQFERSMDRFRNVRREMEAKVTAPEIPPPTSARRPTTSNSPPPRRVNRPRPRVSSQPPRRRGVCPAGWLPHRDAVGQVFCRCPSSGQDYQDPNTMGDYPCR